MGRLAAKVEDRRSDPLQSTARRASRRAGRLMGQVVLEVFLALLPTDLSAFLGVVVRSRGAFVLAVAHVLAGALVLARAIHSTLNLNVIKVS